MKKAETYMSFVAFILMLGFVWGISHRSDNTQDPSFLKTLDLAVLFLWVLALIAEVLGNKIKSRKILAIPLILVAVGIGVASLCAGYGWQHGFAETDDILVRGGSVFLLAILTFFFMHRPLFIEMPDHPNDR